MRREHNKLSFSVRPLLLYINLKERPSLCCVHTTVSISPQLRRPPLLRCRNAEILLSKGSKLSVLKGLSNTTYCNFPQHIGTAVAHLSHLSLGFIFISRALGTYQERSCSAAMPPNERYSHFLAWLPPQLRDNGRMNVERHAGLSK